MSRITPVGTAWTGKVYVSIISVKDDIVLVREIFEGAEYDVPFSDLQEVWPAQETIDMFAELVASHDMRTAYAMFVMFTDTTGWADVVRSKWTTQNPITAGYYAKRA